jgi:hypothetical protein
LLDFSFPYFFSSRKRNGVGFGAKPQVNTGLMISPLCGFLSWQKIRKHINNKNLTTLCYNNNMHAPVLPLQGELEGVFPAGAVPMTIVDAIRAFQTMDL